MNAIEIRGLTKNFGQKQAVKGLNMTVPMGAIYGFIGENGSGKSTTEKLICGLLQPSGGSIHLFGKDYTDADVRARIGVLIEAPGCYPNASVWNNMMLQAANLGLKNPEEEIARVLKRMADVRNSEVLINGGGTGYRFNQEGNQVTYRCDVKRVTTINFDRKVVRNFAAELNRRADAVSAELDRCLVNSEVAYEAPFDVNDSFAEIFSAFAEAQGEA